MRVGIVNDLPLAVESLSRVLALRPEHQVAWVARSGEEAVDCCLRDTPDLILMDLIMPKMDGVEATRQIMARCPCAILVVTVSVSDNAHKVFEAMGAGALDAVDTVTLGSGDLQKNAAPLLAKMDMLNGLIGSHGGIRPKTTAGGARGSPLAVKPQLLAIGASAGGPAALARVLAGLPGSFSAATVIIQHVDVQFSASMAAWLNQQSLLPVRVAVEGDSPLPGQVLLAATNDHLAFLDAHRMGYTPHPRANNYRPSVDVFFESVAEYWQGEVTAVLLTGMGRDGAQGLKKLREIGAHTIAQDEATSAVFGMPKAAIQLNAAVEILPLEEMAPAIVRGSRHRT